MNDNDLLQKIHRVREKVARGVRHVARPQTAVVRETPEN